MSKNKKDVKNEIPKSKFDMGFSLSSIVSEVNSNRASSFEETPVENTDETNELNIDVQESVSEKVETEADTNCVSGKQNNKGTFKEYLSHYYNERGSKSAIYIHEDLANLLLDIKKRLIKDDNGGKYYAWDIANAMIYGFWLEHKDEINEMMVKVKKKKSLLD